MGKRAQYEGLAIRQYADGKSIEDIAAVTGVSATSLYKWKSESKRPSDDMDEWEKARAQKQSNIQRLKNLFERELMFVEESAAGSITAPSMDALTKLGSLVKRWEEFERAQAATKETKVDIDQPAIFLQNIEWLAKALKDLDPEGLKILANNFDALIIQFKAEHAA